MSCTLTIPDEFPVSWALKSCQQTGLFIGNDIFRDTLPRLVLNKDDCKPTITSLLGNIVSCVLNGLSLFYILVLLAPSVMGAGTISRSVWYGIISGVTIFLPVVLGFVYYGVSEAGGFKDKENTPMWSWMAYGSSMLLYVILLFTFLTGLITVYLFKSENMGLITIPFLIILCMPLAKILLPVMILLLGSGVIPVLAGKSYLEFCTT